MGELGRWMRETREEKNVTLEELSQKTKIMKYKLRALEEENFDVFEAEIYLKGALRRYAEEVGLSSQKVLAKYRQLYRPETEGENEETRTGFFELLWEYIRRLF